MQGFSLSVSSPWQAMADNQRLHVLSWKVLWPQVKTLDPPFFITQSIMPPPHFLKVVMHSTAIFNRSYGCLISLLLPKKMYYYWKYTETKIPHKRDNTSGLMSLWTTYRWKWQNISFSSGTWLHRKLRYYVFLQKLVFRSVPFMRLNQ